ncbi:helix-turn-helix transcriptional regulator [Actinoplanes solisilvae]|uniref:helix-turn-helix transcriptional regulator n=1 Tax=Actinoplanes solisilvae TaxID=2486853 RepID=UPI00196B126E|nr:WYL domain-containing protein [Actinoplanes solisilvae]
MPKTSGRLLALLSLLQARRDWPGALLAERLEVSPRTVRRDVDRLRELGYPIAAIKGPDGGYRLAAGTRMPPLLFDDEQAVALVLALQTSPGDAAARALTTVRQVLPPRLRHRVESLRVSTADPQTELETGVLLAISAAVHAREVLRFDYQDRRRRAEPHHVVLRGGRWYLIAWDLDRDDWRTFRVDRIDPRAPTGPCFAPREIPGGDVTAYVEGSFRPAACRGTVIVDRPAATVAAHTRDGVVEAIDPGRTRLTLTSWSWTSLAVAFGRFDAELEVVGPGELKDAFATLARRFGNAADGVVSADCGELAHISVAVDGSSAAGDAPVPGFRRQVDEAVLLRVDGQPLEGGA